MTAAAERRTAEHYLAFEPPWKGHPRNSLIDGEVVEDPPRMLHQIVAGELLMALHDWGRQRPNRGMVTLPLDVQLDEYNVFNPDVLWYAEGRAPTGDPDPPSPMPDLAVEIRAPSTWRYDIGTKKSSYERHGLPELWLVDTAADVVLAFRRSAPGAPGFDVALEFARGDTLVSPLLPGFALRVDELFDER